jgi:hypothetical protein
MENFDKEEYMKFISEEIKKTGSVFGRFKKEFALRIYLIVQEFYPNIFPTEEIEELLQAYASAILNASNSVFDKDRNYPSYRLEEELKTMNQLTLKLSNLEENSPFGEAIHLQAKAILVEYFSFIYGLSSTGFRLLEKNAKLYNWEFVSNFENIAAHQKAH